MTEFERMTQLLDMSWFLRSEIVPCLVGPPGIGKTAAVMQHAKAHHCGKVIKIVASRCIPSETVGMTMPDHERRTMTIYNSMQLGSLEDGDILFLDELLEADQFVLSTLLTVIESREMADGTPLPDIQIIAATNDTIPPEQLKGNIRQRFMFQRFMMDTKQTEEYIRRRTGITVPNDVLLKLIEKGSDYNFLTPRSLTKLCLWVDATPEDRLDDVARVIDGIWSTMIGTKLVHARRMRDQELDTPANQVKAEVRRILVNTEHGTDMLVEHDNFDDCTMSEMLEILQGMPDWEQIAERLASKDVKEEKEEEVDIQF